YRRSSATPSTTPSRCKVLGCASDLASAPKTHQRFRLCNLHIKAPAILVDGVASRFCQQCSRFHPLTEFHGTNRTCRMMLVKNRARQRGANPFSSPYGAPAVPTAWKQSALPLPLLAFHAAAGETAISATAEAPNMAAAGVSAAGWGRVPNALVPTLTPPGFPAPLGWQVARTHPVARDDTGAGAPGTEAATANCPAAVGTQINKPALLAIPPPEGQPCTAPTLSPVCSSGASSEHSLTTCPSALAAPMATAAVAGARASELPGLQHAASAGGASTSVAGLKSANQPQPLSCTDSLKSYREGAMPFVMPAVPPPPVPCSPANLVSLGAPSRPRTSSVFEFESRDGDGVSVAAEAGPEAGAGLNVGGQAGRAVAATAAATEAFARSPSDGAAVTLAASSTMMATSPVSAFPSERELCIGSELGSGGPDPHSLQSCRAAPQGTSTSMTASVSLFARCSAPPALCQPDCDNVGGQTLDVLRHWQRRVEQDLDQLPPLQRLQAERKPRHHPFQGMRLSRRPSAPQWERPSLQRTLLCKQTCSSLRTRGDFHTTSTSLVHGGGGPNGDDGGLLGGDGPGDDDLSWWSVENCTASLGDDDCGRVGIGGGGGSSNGNGVVDGGSGSGSGGNCNNGGSVDSSMLSCISAPSPDTANPQTNLHFCNSNCLLMNSTSVAAVGCDLSILGALRNSGDGGGDIWGLQRASSFGNFKRRRSLGSEAAGDDGAANVRHCNNAGLAEPTFDAALVAVMSGAVEGQGAHPCIAPQLPVSPLPQGMAALQPSQQQPALATMMPGLGKTMNMLARCAPAGQNSTTDCSKNIPIAELWSPDGCLHNAGSSNGRGGRDGRFGNGGDPPSGRGCDAGDGRGSPLSQSCRPGRTHTATEGQCVRTPSLAVALAVEATTLSAVLSASGGGSRGDAAQPAPRGKASLVLGSLALNEKIEEGAIHTTAAPSGAKAGAVRPAVAADQSGANHNTATGATGSPSAVHGDSLLFASLAAEWQGEGEPDDGADELLLGLDDAAAAGSLIRCRHVEMQQSQSQSQSPSITTMAIQQPQLMVQQLPSVITTEPVSTGLLPTGCASASVLASSFARSSTAAGWWSQSSFSSQKATDATTAMHRERSIAPDVEMMATSSPHTTPMVKPSAGIIVEGGGPGGLLPGAPQLHMWVRSAQSEPAWGSLPSDMACHQHQHQQTPPHYLQHRLGQPSQPPPQQQQQHQYQHKQAAQQSSCIMEDRDRAFSNDTSVCRLQQDDAGAGMSICMSGRKAVGEETEEQLQLLLGDLIGSDMPLQPRLANAVQPQPTQILPTPALTSSLLQQLRQQYYCGIPLPLPQAIESSRTPPPPPPLLPQSHQPQQQQGPFVVESDAGSGSGYWGANISVQSSNMLIEYPSQSVSASLAITGSGSCMGAGCGSSQAAHKAAHQRQYQQQHLLQQQQQQQQLGGRYEGPWPRDKQAIAEFSMTDTATAPQAVSLEAVPCTAAVAAATAIGSIPTSCLRSQSMLDALDGMVASSHASSSDLWYNHPLPSQQQKLQQQQQEKQQQEKQQRQPHVSSRQSGSSTRHSRRSHRYTSSTRYDGVHDGVARRDRDFMCKAVQQQQQLWGELRSMQEQQHALLEQQLEQQRALAKLLGGGAQHVGPGSIAAPAGGGGAIAVGATAAVNPIADVVGYAAAATVRTTANTLSLLEAWQKQQQQQQDGAQLGQGGGGGGSCGSLLSHLQPAVPVFGRWSMPVLRDGGNVENIPSVEQRDWQVRLQQPGSRLQQGQGELSDGLQPQSQPQSQPQEHHDDLALPTRCHGRNRFTRHIHQSHQPLEQHRPNKQQSSPRGTSSPAVLSPASPERF
ncbi:hypothetical protein VaNZ11_008626, partial [Volvox africanus]